MLALSVPLGYRWRMPKRLTRKKLEAAQAGFVEALPKMENVMRFRLRGVRGERKDELMAEATAIAWNNYLQLIRDGRDPAPMVNKIAEFACKGVLSDRRLAGQDRSNDAMSRLARRKRGFLLQSIEVDDDEDAHPELLSALRDHREPSPADEAAARADIGDWVDGLEPRLQRAAEGFAAGLDNKAVGELEGHGRGTGYQLRRALKEAWAER